MSLTGENRTIVRLGLEALRRTGRPGLRALLHEAGLDERPLTATAIGYTLAPRINASGRMGCASLAGELLLTDDPARGEELSRALCDLNRERQAIEAEIDLADAFDVLFAGHECHNRGLPFSIRFNQSMFLNTQNSMELLVRLVIGGTDGHLLGGLLFALEKHKEQNQTHCESPGGTLDGQHRAHDTADTPLDVGAAHVHGQLGADEALHDRSPPAH